MESDTAQTITFILALVALTAVLIWGLKKVSTVMMSKNGDSTVMREMVSEDGTSTVASHGATEQQPGKESFNRIAGVIGAVALAATIVGIGYWAIYALFYKPADLAQLKELGTYFLAGSALFFPYAFNQLSKIFKTG